ncbi:MAG: hypothetical protein IAA16_09265 [Candidatus Treponema excrementipullorum]|uniref:Uncharacterized protein n=1 Tax=Candidatus Treponema excrementipullorum TaxID=2838768 RepID=A0A9E2NZK5_9SPIR|nr:hypothetical protein [Candidatus Treponema excrementipullorum]
MNTTVTITVDSEVYEDFCKVLKFSRETEQTLIENYMLRYIIDTYKKNSKPIPQKITTEYKIKSRIASWVKHPEQINHRILKAFFYLHEKYGTVTLDGMKMLCSQKDTDFYVKTFESNYASMKTESGHNHGKVFEDDKEKVWIAPEVEVFVMSYKSEFLEE